jgi:homoserine dehydrogenase
VHLDGDAAGPTLYSGAGAGRLPTASAIVADLVDIARGENARPPLGVALAALRPLPLVPREEVRCAWYLRLTAEDRPGVMSQLSNCLGAEGISIEALIQKPPQPGASTVPIVVLTDSAREDALRRAVQAIQVLDAVVESPHCIRCEAVA